MVEIGLDMSLDAKKYFYNESINFKSVVNSFFPETKPFEVKQISLEVGYWRKVNHVHNWFVKNVQEGNDDCGEYYVTKEQLQQLLDLCTEVLNNKDKAPELLPTQQGFFFGGTHYDDWYFETVHDTIDIINKVMLLPDDWNIYYSSSW